MESVNFIEFQLNYTASLIKSIFLKVSIILKLLTLFELNEVECRVYFMRLNANDGNIFKGEKNHCYRI